jgi:prepilin-type N-terminal cleavage/methylation domain-containing protein
VVRQDRSPDAGFTIVEVLVAMLLIATAALGAAGLFDVAVQSSATARVRTGATLLASQKMEQLLALTWRFDPSGSGVPESDLTSDLSYDPPRSGGTGLGLSPAGTLGVSTPGYADYVDASGRWVGQGATPPAAAVFARRWSIRPLPADPVDGRVIQVVVRPIGPRVPAGSVEVVMTSIRTRTGS